MVLAAEAIERCETVESARRLALAARAVLAEEAVSIIASLTAPNHRNHPERADT
jgi:hypothetical protein